MVDIEELYSMVQKRAEFIQKLRTNEGCRWKPVAPAISRARVETKMFFVVVIHRPMIYYSTFSCKKFLVVPVLPRPLPLGASFQGVHLSFITLAHPFCDPFQIHCHFIYIFQYCIQSSKSILNRVLFPFLAYYLLQIFSSYPQKTANSEQTILFLYF